MVPSYQWDQVTTTYWKSQIATAVNSDSLAPRIIKFGFLDSATRIPCLTLQEERGPIVLLIEVGKEFHS